MKQETGWFEVGSYSRCVLIFMALARRHGKCLSLSDIS